MKLLRAMTLLLFIPSGAFAFTADVSAKSAIVMNADTGQVIYQKNGYERVFPASTTKVATAIYALEKNRDFLDHNVVAEQDSIGAVTPEERRRGNYSGPSYRLMFGGTHMGIKKGEILPLRALIYGLMLSSANDAANVIAQYTSGKIPVFMKEMNTYLAEIGCKNTQFNNPHGLHHPSHYTTPYDLALMAKKGLEDPLFREVVSTVRYVRPKTNMQEPTTLVQGNRLLRAGPYKYEYAIGVKTGFTDNSGHNLVAAAEKNGRTLIAVVIGCPQSKDSFNDAIALFNAAFFEPPLEGTLIQEGVQPYKVSVPSSSPVQTYATKTQTFKYYPSEEIKVKATIHSLDKELPIKKGDQVATVMFKDQHERVLGEAPLYSYKDVNGSIGHRLHLYYQARKGNLRMVMLGCIVVLCLLLGRKVIVKTNS